MPARTRSELPLFRDGQSGHKHVARSANYEEKQTMAGNKTARNVFKGQCVRNCLAEVKARGCARRLLCSECNFVGWCRPRSVSG
jgi:hypothetical protein